MAGEEVEMMVQEVAQPEQLLQAWREMNLKALKQALDEGCDPDFVFGEGYFMPILGLLADQKHPAVKEMIAAVLAKGARVDKQMINGKCAIHMAAEGGNLAVLQALVEGGADTGAKDQRGGTALHSLVRTKWKKGDTSHRSCLEFLLDKVNTEQLNITDRAGYSAIHLATKEKNAEAVEIILGKGSLLQVDGPGIGKDKVTPRTAIQLAFPQLAHRLPPDMGPDWSFIKMDSNNLFKLLYHEEEDRFCVAFEKEMQDEAQKNLLTANDGQRTLLQQACESGLAKAVKSLLSSGADPNLAPNDTALPINIVVRKGHVEVLQNLLASSRLEVPTTGDTPLHELVKYCRASPPHLECLSLLLMPNNPRPIDVNARDVLGNTALHYALLYSDPIVVTKLIQNGAYIGIENNEGKTPLQRMPAKLLQEILDSNVTEEGLQLGAIDYTLHFNFDFLEPPGCRYISTSEDKLRLTGNGNDDGNASNTSETKPLLLMSSNPELKPLLVHPLLTAFTFLKWQRIQAFFYINLAFYLAFCILLTGYILFAYRIQPPTPIPTTNSIDEGHFEKVGLHEKVNLSKPDHDDWLEPTTQYPLVVVLRVIILMFIFVLFLRELFQFVVRPLAYFCNVENWLELGLIGVSAVLVVADCVLDVGGDMGHLCPQLCAIAILVSWFELVLLIGKHPRSSVQVEMFRTVSVSFMRFLSWYVLLIIAFALSFFVLFRGCPADGCENNPFTNPATSLFKTTVMLTGEFEAGDIPFLTFIGTSHLIFIAFVFLIVIVLVNLLNGLAVADTRDIRDDAYLYTCVARVRLIAFVEEMLHGNKFSFCNFLLNSKMFQYFSKNIDFFPDLLINKELEVFPNDGNRVDFGGKDSLYYLDEETVKKARQLTTERSELAKGQLDDDLSVRVAACCDRLDAVEQSLNLINKSFEAIAESNKQIEKLLIQNMAIVSLNNADSEDR